MKVNKEIIILDEVVGNYSGKRYKVLRERLNKDGTKTVRLKLDGWMSVESGAQSGKDIESYPVNCQECRHHHCHHDEGIQDCSCDLSVFATTQTMGIPNNCPLKRA